MANNAWDNKRYFKQIVNETGNGPWGPSTYPGKSAVKYTALVACFSLPIKMTEYIFNSFQFIDLPNMLPQKHVSDVT